jgi:S1-C subfamily serine protease
MSKLASYLRIWLLSFAAIVLTGTVQAHNPLPDTLAKVRPSIVAVGKFDPTGRPRQVFLGTGFVVGNGHQVITNHHVLPTKLSSTSKETLAVFSGRGKKVRYHEARLLAKDVANDLALLYISTPLPAMQLGSAARIREGEEIAFTGFPLGMVLGLYPVTHRGIVSAIMPAAQPQVSAKVITPQMIRAMRRASSALQLDATAYPGNSGSPVYSPSNGRVIGVINSVFVKGNKEAAIEKPSGITYAIDVKHVHKLLEQAGN